MLSLRLSLALDEGELALPEDGTIAVFAPLPGTDLSALPKDRVEVISRHFPVHSSFQSLGYATKVKADGPYAMVIACLPRAKAEARAIIAEALERTTGLVVIDGQKTDGIESMLKELKKRGSVGNVIVKAHGKLFTLAHAECADWVAKSSEIARENGAPFQTAPGVFSADGIDPGSEALIKALPHPLSGHVIDLGAGWGYLSDALLTHPKIKALHLVEADHAALTAARANITDPRARFHWADALHFATDTPVDHVITNPPFHTGRSADPGLGQAFIQAAARLLKPRGHLWLVANRHLPYERTLEDAFREVRTLAQTPSYKITLAEQPRSTRKG
ncbi:methyltransferase [Rhodobacteraceae bacterium]|nr:methyltransferase [Paracoccaceae bacterium]